MRLWKVFSFECGLSVDQQPHNNNNNNNMSSSPYTSPPESPYSPYSYSPCTSGSSCESPNWYCCRQQQYCICGVNSMFNCSPSAAAKVDRLPSCCNQMECVCAFAKTTATTTTTTTTTSAATATATVSTATEPTKKSAKRKLQFTTGLCGSRSSKRIRENDGRKKK